MDSIPVLDFPIPTMPNIVEIPEPRPGKKPPISGYDVKTLRKQVEFLQDEIREREEKHELLYRQNRELWEYTHKLMDASRGNAHRMKDHVAKLYGELKHSHEIRSDLAAKLIVARDSKSLVKQIFKAIREAKVSMHETEHLVEEAEQALSGARTENEILESSLRSKMERLQLIHWQIDENKNKEKVDALMSLAEEFWGNSSAVLRSAFQRFRRGVGRRIRQSHLFSVFSKVYRRYLLEKYFDLMRFFKKKRSFMQRCIQRNAKESARQCLVKWRLHTAMEIFCHRSRKMRLLRSTFAEWLLETKEKLRDKMLSQAKQKFEARQLLLRCLRAWKNEALSLHWHDPKLRILEGVAINHLKIRILRNWSYVARKALLKDVKRSRTVVNMVTRGLFDAWRGVCLAQWQRRGLLLMRFIRNCQNRVVKRLTGVRRMSRISFAMAAWRRHHHVYKWLHFSSVRLRIRRKANQFASQNLFFHRRLLKHFLTDLQVFTATIQRRQYCFQAATLLCRRRTLLLGLRTWRRHAVEDIQRRRSYVRKMFCQAIYSWRIFIERRRHVHQAAHVVTSVQNQKNKQQLRQALCELYWVTVRRRRSFSCARTLSSKISSKITASCFRAWRCKWTSVIFWRMKETSLEATRVKAVVSLKGAEVESLQRNRDELQKASKKQLEKMASLQQELDLKEDKLRDSAAMLESRRAEREALEKELVSLQEQLAHVSDERRKLEDIEQMLLDERKKENLQLEERKKEAEALVETLRRESRMLGADVDVAREQLSSAKSEAVRVVENEKTILRESEETAEAMEELLKAKELEAQSLSEGHLKAQETLAKLQRTLNDSLKDGFATLHDSESSLRSRISQVRVTNNSANMIEARNTELAQILREEEEAFQRLQNTSMHEAEDHEAGMLSDILISVNSRAHRLASKLDA